MPTFVLRPALNVYFTGGIMGAFAGGHLVYTAATHFTSNMDRPDFLDAQYARVLSGKQPGADLV